MNNKLIPAINFHIWKYCNFKCKFCFATYEDEQAMYNRKSHLSELEMLNIIDEIAKQNITKITFAGGEPMLCKWLPNLIKHSKEAGLTTMIVTNGFLLTNEWIEKQNGSLDWITLSIDSIVPKNQMAIGRSSRNRFITTEDYLNKIKLIKANNIKLKLNTVVCSINAEEDISNFILEAKPQRWKIFQVLPMVGQNDIHIDNLIISNSTYEKYIARHRRVKNYDIEIVAENNDLMTGSYLMIDPQGRLYDNINGTYQYSEPILNVGFDNALEQVTVYQEKFAERNGLYEW